MRRQDEEPINENEVSMKDNEETRRQDEEPMK